MFSFLCYLTLIKTQPSSLCLLKHGRNVAEINTSFRPQAKAITCQNAKNEIPQESFNKYATFNIFVLVLSLSPSSEL